MSEIIIDNKNKEIYSNGPYPEVTSIEWIIGKLDENILKNFPNLTRLNCSDNQITDLSPLQVCTSGLTELDCSYNSISDLSTIQGFCSGLATLWCNDNQITDLSPLQVCGLRLTELDCSYNLISDLSIIQLSCSKLTRLWCNNNQITDLNPLQYCIGLTELYCLDNHIKNLSPLKYCTLLTKLDFNNNQISDLNPLRFCTRLNQLFCAHNKITSLEPLIYLRRLTHLYTSDNPLNPASIQVTRLLERIEVNRTNYYNNNSIYSDTQNVHDVKVQQSVMDSVRNLMRDNNVSELDIESVLNSELKVSTKSRLLEYFEETDYHVILLITYKELFTYVWSRIMKNPNKLELLKILDDNIQDSECKCFTGRFNRTLSTLVGFYDDIEINISDNSRISAIILQVKDTIIPYDVTKHKELARITLLEAGYDSETIELWTTAIE